MRRAKDKVTSGRLTGSAEISRQSPEPGPSPWPEPVYSLYSSDSEDQVSSLHRGLDQCATLLSGILQAEKAGSAEPPRTPKRVTAQSRPATSLDKKNLKRFSTKPGSGLTRTVKSRGTRSRPSNSQGKMTIRPPPSDVRRSEPVRTCSSAPGTRKVSAPAVDSGLKPRPSVQKQTTRTCPETDGDHVPVRDIDVQVSTGRLDPGQEEKRPEDTSSSCRRTEPGDIQNLLRELRALIAGQGSLAEGLLRRLEQTLSSNLQTEPEPSSGLGQNSHLCRCEQQETLSNSKVVVLQEELSTARSRLLQLQDRVTELQKVLQDTQSRLRDTETDLEATKLRLQQSERQQEDMLKRLRQSPSDCPRVQNLPRLTKLPGSKQDPAAPPSDRIHQYLMSLRPMEPTQNPHRSSSEDVQPWRQHTSQYEVDSVCSDWTTRSSWTFNTRDQAAFEDGLAALDASIASLQRTLQLDLKN